MREYREGVPGGNTGMEYQEEILNRVLGGGFRRGYQKRTWRVNWDRVLKRELLGGGTSRG